MYLDGPGEITTKAAHPKDGLFPIMLCVGILDITAKSDYYSKVIRDNWLGDLTAVAVSSTQIGLLRRSSTER